MTNRKFHKTIIQVEVLSEEPFEYNTLDDVARAINDDCSGATTTVSTETLDGKQCAEALQEQASDPQFFGLTEDGNDDPDSPYADGPNE